MQRHFTIQVPRSPDLDQQLERFAARLERLLWVFPAELARLHGRLIHNNGRIGTVCSLDLHTPTAQLHAEEAAPTAQAALHAAGEELTAQLKKHHQRLSELRRRRTAPMPPGTVWSEANPGGGEPHETPQRELGDFIGEQMQRLESFVARRLQAREDDGEIESGAVEAREVLDEVVVEALSAPPREMVRNRERWFRILAERAIRRLAKAGATREPGQTLVSLERELAPEPGEEGERFVPEDVLDANTPTPEQIAYTDEMLGALTAAARRLTRDERHDLLLWLIEGFTAQEIAGLSQRPLEAVQASLAAARKHIGSHAGALPAELRQRLS